MTITTVITKGAQFVDISNDLNKEESSYYVDLIKKTRDRTPFWKMYQDFLVGQQAGEFDQFISARPQPRSGE